MLANRSVPPCTVIPVLRYPDPRTAADWLCKAFGFTVRLRVGENHRIQMKFGDGCLIVAEGKGAADNADYVMLRVPDAKSHCEHARQAGARILSEPVDHMYGERQYNAEDFAGHRWTFTQTIDDVDPRDWGGVPVDL
ncbi:MAG TPA: VOC family protein [Candidatus Acidoferrales bacterium]|nr:VOC family protein [Candidatus Acidoferrales bacterium]